MLWRANFNNEKYENVHKVAGTNESKYYDVERIVQLSEIQFKFKTFHNETHST